MNIVKTILSITLLMPLLGQAQEHNVPRMVPSPEQLARRAYSEALADLPGTGRYQSEKKIDASLPQHTIYLPSDLSSLGDERLGIVLFGNGGCGNDGAAARNHHLEIASHGYLVIAPGRIYSGPNAEEKPPAKVSPETGRPLLATVPEDLIAGLDWALAQNSDKNSALYQKLDSDAVAVSGWSCGGLQALNVAVNDSRIKTLIMHNTGTFPEGNMILNIALKSDLAKLKVPTIYLIGGPDDIAFPNGSDDFSKIDQVPVVLANLQVGHSGTFAEPYGGRIAQVTLDWLQWQLYGDESAGRTFTGKACRLCLDPTWSFQRKGL
jgi:hypothetical protein